MGEEHNRETLYLSTIAFIDEESSTTNEHYLLEFCKVVIYESGFLGLTSAEICQKIKELVLFDYSEEEIVNAINQCETGDIILNGEHYSLSSEAAREYEKRAKNSEVRKYVDLFCDTRFPGDSSIKRDDLCNLITKFLFERFQQSVDQIYRILENSKDLQFVYSLDYSEEEKDFINLFLAWDNESKNKMIYDLIVKSYDFCTLNCAENVSVDFKNFHFYLDANIIMRLLGINNTYRQGAVEHFIKKCNQAGIVLHISSFTKKEIEQAIDSQIRAIARDLQYKGFIPTPDAMKFALPDKFTIEMYGKYYEYYKSNKKDGGLESFRRFLLAQLEAKIKDFVYDDADSFEIEDKNKFDNLVNSLKEIKKDIKLAKTDVNNVMRVLKQRTISPDFYMISADGKLVDWCKEIFVGKNSIVELPSVWLSLLLKYMGRARGQDYTAFCRFIRLPIQTIDKDIKKKMDIQRVIIEADVPTKMKSRMLEELSSNYISYTQYRSSHEVVEKVREKVMSDHDEMIREEANHEAEQEIERITALHEKKEEGLINQLRKDSELIKKQEGESVYYRLSAEVSKKTEKRLKCGKWVTQHYYRIFLPVAIVLSIIGVVFFLFLKEKFEDKLALLGVVIAGIDIMLNGIFIAILNAIKEKFENREEIETRITKRLQKKYKNIL